tara:strand:- start:10392 stop:11747 length:1356 start_codon:yes stop_codon:yes gene_type:complete
MRNVATFFQLLPYKHQKILSALGFIMLAFFVIPFDYLALTEQNQELQANKRYKVALPDNFVEEQEIRQKKYAYHNPLFKSLSSWVNPINHVEIDEELTVRPGDSLSSLFKKYNLSTQDAFAIMQLPKAKRTLRRVMPGDKIQVIHTDNQLVLQLRYHFSSYKELIIERTSTGFKERVAERQIEKRSHFYGATIKDNFWNAATKAGLAPAQIMDVANLFGWDIDFALDIRAGDSFSVMYEEKYTGGFFLEHGHIIAAEFINQNKYYKAVRYQDGEYYNEKGRSMRKAFLRSPVDFTRVSSGFSLRRLHPVTGRIRPHRGVDYAAPIGTPIKAAGNGRIIASSYNAYNGHYIFIKHNRTYTTKYLHLNRRYLKKGAYVKQGQIIGTVGRTGRATGPHLHYEFIVNGRHRNPRTVRLPKSKPIHVKEKKKFSKISVELFDQLKHHKQVQLTYYE